MALHLLLYFTYWINLYLQASDSSYLPTESHGRWIFSLLSRIDDYISADDMHLLRNLARACLGLLKKLKQEKLLPQSDTALGSGSAGKMRESSCWIIITSIATVWKQRDLWIDAEDLLRRHSLPAWMLTLKYYLACQEHLLLENICTLLLKSYWGE